MKFTSTPTEYEIYDETDLAAKINMFDEGASSVEIKTVVNPDSWFDLAEAIHKALLLMHPKDEK